MPTCRITICDNRGQAGTGTMPLRPLTTKGRSKARASATGPAPQTRRMNRAHRHRLPAETSVPYERTKAPEPEPSHQHTIAELCSTKDFVEWVTVVADFQALVEPEVHGVLQAAEFGGGLDIADGDPDQTPTIMCDLPKVPLRDKKVSWETLLTGTVIISEEGRLTIEIRLARSSERKNRSSPEPPCRWEASTLSFSMPYVCRSTSGKRAHNSTRCVIHYATGDSEEEGAPSNLLLMEKRPSKNSARSPALNQVEFSLRRDENLQIGATHASTSARRRTTTAGIGMKIGEPLPNGLGSRGSPIAGINDAFSPSCMTRSGHRPGSVEGAPPFAEASC